MLQAEHAGLRSFIHRLCRDRQQTEDLTQEALTRAWQYRASFRPDGPIGPWLHRIAFRCFLDARRLAGRQPCATEGNPNSYRDPKSCSPGRRLEIAQALDSLASRERSFILRFHRDGESLKEIAESSGLPVGTVKSILHRSRRKLVQEQIKGDRE
ncbi:MAG: RNA polymerase sigma factor [Planctomycetota bacterium]